LFFELKAVSAPSQARDRGYLWQLGRDPFDGLPATPRLRADHPGRNAGRDRSALLEVGAPFADRRKRVKQKGFR
jgi:hypothetical protein